MSIFRSLYNLNLLRRNVWLKPSQLKEIQWKKVKVLLKNAYENVRLYHRKFNSVNIKPENIKTMEDLQKIPIITKSEVQRNFQQIVSKGINVNKCEKHRTSGSTGVPLTIIEDDKAIDFRRAINLRWFLECGGRFSDKWVDYKTFSTTTLPKKRFYQHFGILRTHHFRTTDAVNNLIPALNRLQPDVIRGYPSFLEILARTLQNREIEINPRLVFSFGELLDRNRRMFINSTFGVEMLDFYGCDECSIVAWECPEHAGYHINSDSVLVEFIKDGETVAPGEKGELVLTSLFNSAMPLIRYNIGDVGVPSDEECPCGRGLPLMKIIEGRSEDFIVLPSGRILSPLAIWRPNLIKSSAGIARYRIIQEEKNRFQILLVLKDGYRQEIVDQFRKGFEEVIMEGIEIEIKVVDAIPRDKSGKLRRLISKVHNPFLH